MKDSNNPAARREGLVIQELPEETLVYDVKSNKAHCLNHSAALVWRACNGNNSIADIRRQFESAGGGKVTDDFIWLAIDQLNAGGLLDPGIARRFAGHSRRKAIKAIAIGSVAAVPVVSSLVAPSSVYASVSCGCTAPADCSTAAAGCLSMTICNGSGVCAP